MRLIQVLAVSAVLALPIGISAQADHNDHRHFHQTPEPSAMILLATAMGGVILARRKILKRRTPKS